jgi:hypothetical protein
MILDVRFCIPTVTFRFEIMSNPIRCGRLGSWNESWAFLYAQRTQTKEGTKEGRKERYLKIGEN